MTSFKIDGTDKKYEILAGWDPALNTYFAHVIDTTKDEEEEGRDVLWIGCTPSEIHDVEIVYNQLRPYVTRPIGEQTMSDFYRDANS